MLSLFLFRNVACQCLGREKQKRSRLGPWLGRSEKLKTNRNQGLSCKRKGENNRLPCRRLAAEKAPAIRWYLFSARIECHIAFYAISVLTMWLLRHYCVLPQLLHTVFVSVTLLLCFYFLQIWATQLQCNLQWMASLEE